MPTTVCVDCGKRTSTWRKSGMRRCLKCYKEHRVKNAIRRRKDNRILCPKCGANRMWPISNQCWPCRIKERRALKKQIDKGLIPTGVHCTTCGVELNADNWPNYIRKHYNLKCHPCFRKGRNEYQNSIYYSQRKPKQEECQNDVLKHYGAKCSCCNEQNPVFLSIDHINNDGGKRRKAYPKEFNIYRFAKMNNYPKDLQILCRNCNWGKHANKGICPHQMSKVAA